MLRAATSAALVGVAAGTINLAIEDCGDSSTLGHVYGISPSSVPQGTSTKVSGSGHLDATVSDGSFDVNVKAAGVSLTKCSGNLCSASKCALPAGTGSVDFRGVACPLSAGDVSLDFDVSVSSLVPSSLAHLTIEISSTGSAGKLLCAKLTTSPGLEAKDDAWENFKNTYGKTYNGPDHEAEHRAVYESNMQWAREHSTEAVSFGENQFADLTTEQFKIVAGLGYKPNRLAGLPHLGVHTHNGEELADSVDWSVQGAVTPVKDQGQCGSCWAFSTTGGMEGAWQIASGSLTSMSEQQLVDCSTQNAGCNGGDMGLAFDFAGTTNVATESSYPYKGTDGSCKTSYSTAIPKGGVTGYKSVGQSTADLKSAIMQGPVSVAIEADQLSFQLYSGGVLESGTGFFTNCGTNLDHGVLAVGYTADAFKVKNSWGASWGESGYIQLSTNGNTCGIHSDATYPVVSAGLKEEVTGACTGDEATMLGDPADVGQKASDCGTSSYNIFTGNFNHGKFNDCFTAKTGISAQCAECYAVTGEYGAKNCKSSCLLGWCKSGCLSCTAPAQADLSTCTGFQSGTADPCDDVSV